MTVTLLQSLALLRRATFAMVESTDFGLGMVEGGNYMPENQEAADAAGQAAYDQAGKSHWPPTKEDVELIGAAAGTAAGSALGGPVGAIIGSAVGTFVGGVVYDIVDAIPNAGDNPASRCVLILEDTVEGNRTTISKLAQDCSTSETVIVEELHHWGWPGPLTDRNICRNPSAALAAIDTNNRQFFKAVAATAAECKTLSLSRKSSPAKAVAIVAGIGLLGWLLKKAILRV